LYLKKIIFKGVKIFFGNIKFEFFIHNNIYIFLQLKKTFSYIYLKKYKCVIIKKWNIYNFYEYTWSSKKKNIPKIEKVITPRPSQALKVIFYNFDFGSLFYDHTLYFFFFSLQAKKKKKKKKTFSIFNINYPQIDQKKNSSF